MLCNMHPSVRNNSIIKIISSEGKRFEKKLLTKGTFQNDALTWILENDDYYLCPSDDNVIQRYAATAVLMSLNQNSTISYKHECQWRGIKCNLDRRVKEVKYERSSNNLLPEVSLLSDIESMALQEGKIRNIPLAVYNLKKMKNFDMDKNQISGEFPVLQSAKMAKMTNLLRLDFNYNFLSGGIDFLLQFPNLREAHLDNNKFSGTIPDSLGAIKDLGILTLHNNNFTGTMPSSICDLRKNFKLYVLTADCGSKQPKVECECCTHCL